MPKFKDNLGHEYHLSLNYGIAVKIEDELGIPILSDPLEVKYNIRNSVSMAYLMCEAQISEYGLNATDFGTGFGPEELGDLTDAVVESVVLFLQGQQPEDAMSLKFGREMQKLLAVKTEEMMSQVLESHSSGSVDFLESILTGEPGGKSQKCLEEDFLKRITEEAAAKIEESRRHLSELRTSMNSDH
jgi:hypothetical protein